MAIRLVTLIENTNSAHRATEVEHGLSFYLDTPHTQLMFDFGESGKVYDNMVRLAIPISQIRCAVCSHAHYDHGGGFKYIAPKMHFDTLITGQGFWVAKYAQNGNRYTYLGPAIDEDLLKREGIQHKECYEMLQLTEDCWVISNFERETNFESIPPRFVLETSPGHFEPDLFNDEVCLAVETGKGLAVIVGCSHPGIINMLHTIQKRLQRPILSVWGGAHLVAADEEQIRYTAQQMAQMGLKRVGLCHCSGEQLAQLEQYLPGIECCRVGTGDTVFL